jgi:hypothetical protein
MLLYRIVLTNPPSMADFVSEASRGVERRVRPGYERLRSGVSIFDSEDRARQRATRWPWLGGYIAELDLPDDGGPIRYERTTDSRGHYTAWGRPEDLVGRVVRVVRV